MHLKFNFEKRTESQFSNVEYFMRCYERAIAFDAAMMDKVFDESVANQLLTEEDIPQSMWE